MMWVGHMEEGGGRDCGNESRETVEQVKVELSVMSPRNLRKDRTG